MLDLEDVSSLRKGRIIPQCLFQMV